MLRKVVRDLSASLKPYRGETLVLLFALLIEVAFNVVMPLSFKYLLDNVIPTNNRSMLWLILGVMTAAVVVAAVAAIGRDYLYARLGNRVVTDLRRQMFQHLQRLAGDYYDRSHVADIMARFSTDLTAITNGIVRGITDTVLGCIGVVLYSTVLFFLSPSLALITVISLPLLLIGPRWLGPKAEAHNLRTSNEEVKISAIVQENVSAQPVVKAFGLADLQTRTFNDQLRQHHESSLRFNLLSYLIERTPNLTFLFLQLAVLALGAVKTFDGSLKIGALVAFNTVLLSLSGSVTSLTRVAPLLVLASSSFDRVGSLLKETPTVVDADEPKDWPGLGEGVVFDDVSFSYTGQRPDLDQLTFTIPAGANVAIVGPSGSGKSTILSLLMRFIDPSDGRVLVAGEDIRELAQAAVREQLGVVFQESYLFNTTIAENIRTGRLDATDEEVAAAARGAEIHDVIMAMPDGYETVVGERGRRLSGGQRQRVALARALVRNPAILILDEVTSALDPGTEALVNATLRRIASRQTVVSVSHRLSSITDCDRIFVLDQGRLVEQGRHDDLLAASGLYQDLWTKQSGIRVSDDGTTASVSIGYLRSVSILSGFPDEVLSGLARLFATERLPEGRTVMYQDDTETDKFYLVARGRLEVLKGSGGGEQRRVAVLQDGDHFGEIALMMDIARTASVRAITPCVLLSLHGSQFREFIDSDPLIKARVLETIAVRRADVLDDTAL